MPWYRHKGAGLLIRFFGLMLMMIAAAAAALLRGRALHGPIQRDPVGYVLALAGFLGGTGGLGLAVLGSHVYDRVEISRRWWRFYD